MSINTVARLARTRALVTGGSRGIGLAIARALAARGAACTLVGRDAASLTEAVASLPALASAPAPVPNDRHPDERLLHDHAEFDVADADGWARVLETDKTRTYDILINAAGVAHNSLLHRTNEEVVKRVLDTNLLGTTLGCRTFAPHMIRHKRGGCVVNVSSLLATNGGRGASVYAASKAGVIGLTRALASEVGRFGIRANVLLPGYISTEMTEDLNQKGELSSKIPLNRLGLDHEVAHAAVFLVENKYASNCVLNLDGGLSAM